MPIDPIAVFLSSPIDVQAERDRAKTVCQELQAEPAIRERFRLDAYAFEDTVPPIMGEQPQQTVNRYMLRPDDADILVCVLWGRLGSRFQDETGRSWDSGTVYEFETALQRYRRTGRRPIVLLYRCQRPYPAEAAAEDIAQVDRFFARFHDPSSGLTGIFHHRGFQTTEEFADLLRRDLRKVLEKLTPRAFSSSAATPLDALAERVGRMWIDGVLTPSLEGRPPIPLPLAVPPGPYLPDGITTRCFTGIWLKTLFRESKRRLVMTATPGAGKTIALLQLLQLLLEDRAQGAGTAPVPVVLDATSWKAGQPAFDWILQELDRLYGVRPRTARDFVLNKQLIYFIDGLDQIGARSSGTESATPAAAGDPGLARLWCQRLQEFFQDGEWSVAQRTPVVLCCRESHLHLFRELLEAGKFQQVTVQPPEIADVILTICTDPTVAGLATELEQNPQLARLATVPLFLQMLMSVFRAGSPYRPLPNVAEKEQIHELIASYVELRLASEAGQTARERFTIPQVRRWLTWLAQNQNRSPFLIELMQPEMLQPGEQRAYGVLAATALALALTACAVVPVALGLGLEWGMHRGPATGGNVAFLSAAVLFPFALSMLVPAFLWARGLWMGLFLGFAFAAVRGVAIGAGCPDGPLPTGWEAGTRAALFTWLACAPPLMIYSGYVDYRISAIHPLTNWNFRVRQGRLGIMVGIVVGAVFWYFYGPARGITFATAVGMLLTGVLCLQRSGFDVPSQPNHGIVRSTKNAIIFGLAALLIGVPVIGFSYGYQYGLQTGLENGVLAMVLVLAGLMFGGIPVLQHWALRFLCAARDHLPYKLISFLDGMTEMLLVQRVGGAYRFSHDLISGFFAGRNR